MGITDIQNSMHKVSTLRKAKAKEQEQVKRDESKRKLEQNITTKMRTVMIGSLSVFEEIFGVLWGHEGHSLTDEQQEWFDLWQSAREKILDNGNSQIRAAQQELKQYEVNWTKYRYSLDMITRNPEE